jgi:hypothetical protein
VAFVAGLAAVGVFVDVVAAAFAGWEADEWLGGDSGAGVFVLGGAELLAEGGVHWGACSQSQNGHAHGWSPAGSQMQAASIVPGIRVTRVLVSTGSV